MIENQPIHLEILEGGKTTGVITGDIKYVNPTWRTMSLRWRPLTGETETITLDRPVKIGEINKTIRRCAAFIDGEILEKAPIDDKKPKKPAKPAIKKPEDPIKPMSQLSKGWVAWWRSLPEEERQRRTAARGAKSRETWNKKSDAERDKFREECRNRARKHWASLDPEQRKIRSKNVGRKRKKKTKQEHLIASAIHQIIADLHNA